jgi:hypothetical protein
VALGSTAGHHAPQVRRALLLLVLRQRQDQVRKLVAGPGVWICDRCVALCVEILAEP